MDIVIIEDEPLIARRLARLVKEAEPSLQRLEVVNDFIAAQNLLRDRAQSVVMLDLNLHGQDGFDLLRTGAAEGWRTIVVSAHAERAIEAFELGVIDFVLKPFTVDRLKLALQRATMREPDDRLRYVAAYRGNGVALVPLVEIVAVHGAGDYSEVQTLAGKRYLHKKPLQQLSAELPTSFLRVHRSHIVNLQFAAGLERKGGASYLRLDNEECIPVGRSFASALRKRLV